MKGIIELLIYLKIVNSNNKYVSIKTIILTL
jgi:hypothetical protein